MAKITLIGRGVVLQELLLAKERVMIGRRSTNDIVIADPAVSAEHAVIVTYANDSILEDLNSTNGTWVNGQPIRKRFLHDQDVIKVSDYEIRYVSDDGGLCAEYDHECEVPPPVPESAGRMPGSLQILNGPAVGKRMQLNKPLTSVGLQGDQVLVVSAEHNGFSITQVEGQVSLILNGREVSAGRSRLKHGDVIDLSGIKVKFEIG